MPTAPMAGKVNGLISSPPCFPAGTPVVLARGVVAIEAVRVGDLALTHEGRWRQVTATMSRTAPVWADGCLTATADHPFWTREQNYRWNNERRRKEWSLGPAEWTPAAETHGRFVAVPTTVAALPVPPVPGRELETANPFWWMVGRWIGDGWVRVQDASPEPHKKYARYSEMPTECLRCGVPGARHARYPHLWSAYCSSACRAAVSRTGRAVTRPEVFICCGRDEAEGLASKLGDTGLTWTRSEERTATRFSTSHTGLPRWLTEHFGKYAHGKTLPGWAFGMPEADRAALLDGYLSADGHYVDPRTTAADSASYNLATGVRLLASGLGYTTSIFQLGERKRASAIEGRQVKARRPYKVGIIKDDGRFTRVTDKHRWVKRRRPMTLLGPDTVYDITVAEDHSFVAHGIVVHNCTSWSQAGKGKGRDLEGAILEATGRVWRGEQPAGVLPGEDEMSRLVLEPTRWIRDIRPDWVALEQVPSVARVWSELAVHLAAAGYSVWTGVLNAADYGVPQTRRRAILLASLLRQVDRPAPTHVEHPTGQDLFGGGLPGWRSMHDTVGWDGKVGFPRKDDTGTSPDGYRERDWRTTDRPAFGMTEKARSWRVVAPGVLYNADGAPVPRMVTPEEAGLLQTFPAAYPWSGSRTRRFTQIANAVPPLLARHVLSAVTGVQAETNPMTVRLRAAA